MQGLYPAIKDRRIACQIFNRNGFGTQGFDVFQASAGAIHGDLVFFKQTDDGVESLFVIYRYEGIADGLCAGHERVGWIWGKGKKSKEQGVKGIWLPAVRNGCTGSCLEHDFFDLSYADLSQLKPNIVFF